MLLHKLQRSPRDALSLQSFDSEQLWRLLARLCGLDTNSRAGLEVSSPKQNVMFCLRYFQQFSAFIQLESTDCNTCNPVTCVSCLVAVAQPVLNFDAVCAPIVPVRLL